MPIEQLTISFNSGLLDKVAVCGELLDLEITTNGHDNLVTKVEFYANGEVLGERSSAPWKIAWVPDVGAFNISARATDTKGQQIQTQTNIYVKRGLFIPEPTGKDVILVGTWWGAGLTETGNFNFIASITAFDNVNSTLSPNLRSSIRTARKIALLFFVGWVLEFSAC